MQDEVKHIPVMPKEIAEYLRLPLGGCFVDCTLGLGGHSLAAAKQVGAQGRIIGFDRDKKALELARSTLSAVGVPFDLVHDDFRHIDRALDRLGLQQVDGMLFDLGISSFQLADTTVVSACVTMALWTCGWIPKVISPRMIWSIRSRKKKSLRF